MIGWVAVALAADVSLYPTKAELELPEVGITRVVIPPELRSPQEAGLGSHLLLVNGSGEPVPFAWLGGEADGRPERLYEEETGFEWSPTSDPHVLRVASRERAIDGLLVDLHDLAAVTVTVTRDGRRIGGPALVWRTDSDAQALIPLTEPLLGEARVELLWHVPLGRRDLRLGGQIGGGIERLPEQRVDLPLGAPVVQENGYVRYDLELPHPLPVRRVQLHPVEEIVDRQAAVRARVALAPTEGLVEPEYSVFDARPIRRSPIGDAVAERMDVPFDGAQESLVVLTDGGSGPLTIPEATVWLPGAEIAVRDPGRGPFVLYAGAPQGTRPPWDLQVAANDLLRQATARVEARSAGPNEAFVSEELRSGLGAPASTLERHGLAWQRPVVAEGPGLARIGIDAQVLAHCRGDLADLRLVDADGRQIPYRLWFSGAEVSFGSLPFTRREVGERSLLSVQLPMSDAPVSTVLVASDAPSFQRSIAVARVAAGRLVPLRALRWDRATQGSPLALMVGQRVVGDELALEIENGDDPPLPISSVEVRWPRWELVARLPEGPVTLLYGDPRRDAPEYDFARVVVPSRTLPVATLGPESAVERPPLAWFDQVLLGGGIAAFAAGLLAVVVAMLAARPISPRGREPAAS